MVGITIKLSTIFYLVATVLFGLAVLSLVKNVPVVDLGLFFTALGLTVGSVGK